MKCCILILFPFAAWALPQSPEVIAGSLHCTLKSSEVLELSVSDKVMIDWQSFSIEEGESVRFVQPHEMSVVINRVMSSEPSRLMGQLQSNGQMALVNTNGILVGRSGQIDTGRLIASSLPIKLDCFLNEGKWAFEGFNAAKVINMGTIRAKEAILVGSEVEHFGRLDCTKSVGVIAAGQLELKESDFRFAADWKAPTKVAICGTVLAPGGEIYVLGEQVRLENGSLLDVSSSIAGGQIYVGGDRQGKQAAALWTYLDDTATIRADGMGDGSGGSVVLYGGEGTLCLGSISARGGKGGFVEVSGKNQMDFRWKVDVSSHLGSPGELLIDPTNIVITNAGPFTPVVFGVPTSWGALTNPVTIDSVALSTFLNTTGSVTITTNVLPDPGAVGTIQLLSPLAWTLPNASLSLIANSDLTINADIKPTGNGAVLSLTSLNTNVLVAATATQSAEVELQGQYVGTAVNVSAPNGQLLMISQPGFKSHIHSQNTTASGNVVINTQGLEMLVNSTNANPSNVELRSYRGDILIDTGAGDIFLQAGEGDSLSLFGGVNINAGQDSSSNVYGGEVTIRGHNLFGLATPSVLGQGNVSINSFQLLPTSQGNLNVTLSGNLLIQSGIGDFASSNIGAFGGGETNVTVAGNLDLVSLATQPLANFTVAAIGTGFGAGTGVTNVSVGGHLTLQGGSQTGGGFSFATIISAGNANVTVGGTALLQSGTPSVPSVAFASITSNFGNVNFSANQISLVGTATGTPAQVSAPMGSVNILSNSDISLVNSHFTANTDVIAKAGTNFTLSNASSVQTSVGPITLVTDNLFPNAPRMGSGAFVIDDTSFVDASGNLISIYTSQQGYNQISPLATFNGFFFIPGTLFANTAEEVWCTYFPNGLTTFPFTIFYKNCLVQAATQATLIITEFLWDMQSQLPGWEERFHLDEEPYFLRRTERHRINQPKSYLLLGI